jgi:hypothetical protein
MQVQSIFCAIITYELSHIWRTVNTSIVTIISIGSLSFLRGQAVRSANKFPSPLNKSFWDWFQYSHAVDNDGKPLILLHGTKSSHPFEQFKADTQGKGFTSMFFTNNKHIAPAYTGKNGIVFPVYLSMQNPLVLDFSKHDPVYWSQIPINGKQYTTDLIVRNVILSGKYDGVIFKNILDAGPRIFKSKELREKLKGLSNQEANKLLASDIYAVFQPSQIKSIYNRGSWGKGTNNMFK